MQRSAITLRLDVDLELVPLHELGHALGELVLLRPLGDLVLLEEEERLLDEDGVGDAADQLRLLEHLLHDGEHSLPAPLLRQLHQLPHAVHNLPPHFPGDEIIINSIYHLAKTVAFRYVFDLNSCLIIYI